MKEIVKYLPFTIMILILGCSESGEFENKNTPQGTKVTEATSNQDIVPYPFGQPLNSELDYYRWNKVSKSKQDFARIQSNKLTKEALKIVYLGLGEELRRAQSDVEIASLIEEFKYVIDKNTENEALFLAEQIFAMKLQEKLFPEILSEKNVFSLKNKRLSETQLSILEYITKTFVKYGNPNVDLIAVNLYHLSNRLEKNKISELSKSAEENAVKWFGDEVLNCTDCNKKVTSKTKSLVRGLEEVRSYQ